MATLMTQNTSCSNDTRKRLNERDLLLHKTVKGFEAVGESSLEEMSSLFL